MSNKKPVRHNDRNPFREAADEGRLGSRPPTPSVCPMMNGGRSNSPSRSSRGPSNVTPKSKSIPVSNISASPGSRHNDPGFLVKVSSSRSQSQPYSGTILPRVEHKLSTVSQESGRCFRVRVSSEVNWWHILRELGVLVQSFLLAVVLMMYYLIYSYVQLVYYTVRSLVFFHNADGAMKITMGITMITGIVVCISILNKFQRMFYINIF